MPQHNSNEVHTVNRPNYPHDLDHIHPIAAQVINNIEQAVIGKNIIIKYLVTATLAGGHILLDDVPGVGKTTIAKALAQSTGLSYRRIQCTPDLLPSDITGITIFHPGTQAFEFQRGPIFSHILLADEINRTTPRTQSALLEAMEEGQVTIDGTTYGLPSPFLVIATENPIEYQGTFSLPESQLDRFLFRISLGYPSLEDETQILARFDKGQHLHELKPVATPGQIMDLMNEVQKTFVADSIRRYIAEIAQATRESSKLYLGLSPRGSIALYRAAQAWAWLHGRSFVIPDDVIHLAPLVVEHRLVLPRSAFSERHSTIHEILLDIIETIPVPTISR